MPNWSAIEASFLRQSHAQQLGELAASLARLNPDFSQAVKNQFT